MEFEKYFCVLIFLNIPIIVRCLDCHDGLLYYDVSAEDPAEPLFGNFNVFACPQQETAYSCLRIDTVKVNSGGEAKVVLGKCVPSFTCAYDQSCSTLAVFLDKLSGVGPSYVRECSSSCCTTDLCNDVTSLSFNPGKEKNKPDLALKKSTANHTNPLKSPNDSDFPRMQRVFNGWEGLQRQKIPGNDNNGIKRNSFNVQLLTAVMLLSISIDVMFDITL